MASPSPVQEPVLKLTKQEFLEALSKPDPELPEADALDEGEEVTPDTLRIVFTV